MRRKIIAQSKTALTVTLPIKWARNYDLEAGKEVEVLEAGGSLIIEPISSLRKKKSISLKLDMGEYNEFRSLMGGLYRSGYEEIKIRFSDRNIIPLLQEAVEFLYGFEIFDISLDSCVIKSVFKEESRAF